MGLDLFDDLTEERAKSNRRRVEIVRTHATSRITPTGSLAGLIRETTYETQTATQLGKEVLRRARMGMGLLRAKELLATTIPQLEEWSNLATVIRAAMVSPVSDDVSRAAEQYEAASQELASILENLKKLAEMYNRERERPPIDEERLKRGLEDARAGRGMTAAEVIAAIRAHRASEA